MSYQIRAILYLLLAATIWGLSFPIGRHALDTLSPLALSGFRYLFGALAVLPLAWRQRWRQPVAGYLGEDHPLLWLKAGLMCGTLMTIGTILQMYGLANTTAGKAGFMTTLYLSLVPVLAFVIGHIPRLLVWISLGVGLVGLFLLTGAGGGDDGGLSKTDGLILVADIFWAVQVLLTGRYALRVNTWLFSFTQTFTCCVQSLILTIIVGEMPTWHEFVVTLLATTWGIFSVGLAFALQTIAQRHTSSTSAALILPLQAVVGAVAGSFFLGEHMTKIMIIGSVVLMGGSLMAQFAKEPIRIRRGDKGSGTILVLRWAVGGLLTLGSVFLTIRAVI